MLNRRAERSCRRCPWGSRAGLGETAQRDGPWTSAQSHNRDWCPVGDGFEDGCIRRQQNAGGGEAEKKENRFPGKARASRQGPCLCFVFTTRGRTDECWASLPCHNQCGEPFAPRDVYGECVVARKRGKAILLVCRLEASRGVSPLGSTLFVPFLTFKAVSRQVVHEEYAKHQIEAVTHPGPAADHHAYGSPRRRRRYEPVSLLETAVAV